MLGAFGISFASDDTYVDVITAPGLHKDDAAPMWAPVEQALHRMNRSADGWHVGADGRLYVIQLKSYPIDSGESVESYPTGSGKTNLAVWAMQEALEQVDRGDLDDSEPFFTPRAILRQVARAIDSPDGSAGGPDAGPFWSPFDRARSFADEPELDQSGRRFSDPRPISATETHVNRLGAGARGLWPAAETIASPPRRLDHVRHIIAALLRTLTPAWRLRAHAIFFRLSCLLAALRLWRAGVPAATVIVPAGARAAAVRGGPRGPGRFLQSSCHMYVSRALGSA